MNTIVVKRIRTKRLELLRNYFHSCLRRDCLPISTCSLIYLLFYSYQLIIFYTIYSNWYKCRKNKNLFTIGYYHFFKIPNLELGILKDFLQILDFNKAYIVLPILATEASKGAGPILSLSKQILVTRDSDPVTISNFLFEQIEIACISYGIDNLRNYTVVFKFRPIALKEEIVGAISKIQYNIKEKTYQKNVTLMNSKFYNGSIIPLNLEFIKVTF